MGRSRLCLDFVMTCFLVHLVVVSVVNWTFPLNVVWWLVMFCAGWLMLKRSRSLCLFRELLPISVGKVNFTTSSASVSDSEWYDLRLFDRIRGLFHGYRGIRKTSNSNANFSVNSVTPLRSENK